MFGTLRNVLLGIRTSGLKFNTNKCLFGTTSLTFLCLTLTGVTADVTTLHPAKVELLHSAIWTLLPGYINQGHSISAYPDTD